MIRTGDEYRESIRDGRKVWIDGEKVDDVTVHPAFRPIVDARARIYDLAHESHTRDVMSYVDAETGERCPVGAKLPLTKEDWYRKRTAVDTVFDDLGGIVTRVGDETVGEMWSLFDGQDVLNEINPAFSEHIRHHVRTRRSPTRSTSRPTPTRRATVQAPTGAGPRRAAARRPGDRQRDHRARREVRDRRGVRQPGVRQADDRRLGRRRAIRLRGRLRRRHGRAGHQAHLPFVVRGSRAATRTIRCRTGSTRSTR